MVVSVFNSRSRGSDIEALTHRLICETGRRGPLHILAEFRRGADERMEFRTEPGGNIGSQLDTGAGHEGRVGPTVDRRPSTVSRKGEVPSSVKLLLVTRIA